MRLWLRAARRSATQVREPEPLLDPAGSRTLPGVVAEAGRTGRILVEHALCEDTAPRNSPTGRLLSLLSVKRLLDIGRLLDRRMAI